MKRIRRSAPNKCIQILSFGVLISLLWFMASCSSLIKPTIPSKPLSTNTQTPEIEITRWLSLTSGIISIEDGCMKITGDDRMDDYTVVWPPDFLVTVEGNSIKVISGIVTGQRREFFLTTGDKVKLGGGTVNQLSKDLQKAVLENCPSPYWIVGEIPK
jgi:hypothetical protein